ncbi:MAG: hypothetical protein QF886_27055, partial [Planctomycetota bacterium]|nr:hypothetical protein [Planctomycetota bacterium]
MPDDAVMQVDLYDDEHDEVGRKKLAPSESMVVEFKPSLRTGRHLLNARLLDKDGNVLDWIAGVVQVEALFKLDLEISPDVLQPKGTVEVRLSMDQAHAKSYFRLRIRDGFGRVLHSSKAPAKEPMSIQYTLKKPRGIVFDVIAELLDAGGNVMARRWGEFTCPRFGFDDFQVFIWPSSGGPLSRDLNIRLLREAGVTGLYAQPWTRGESAAAARNGFTLWGGNL